MRLIGCTKDLDEIEVRPLDHTVFSRPKPPAWPLGGLGCLSASRSNAELSPNMGDDNAMGRGIQPEVDPVYARCVSDM